MDMHTPARYRLLLIQLAGWPNARKPANPLLPTVAPTTLSNRRLRAPGPTPITAGPDPAPNDPSPAPSLPGAIHPRPHATAREGRNAVANSIGRRAGETARGRYRPLARRPATAPTLRSNGLQRHHARPRRSASAAHPWRHCSPPVPNLRANCGLRHRRTVGRRRMSARPATASAPENDGFPEPGWRNRPSPPNPVVRARHDWPD